LEDVSQTAEGWKFEIVELDEMSFPPVIRATDAEGRGCFFDGPPMTSAPLQVADIVTAEWHVSNVPTADLFDHLVGDDQQRNRHRYSERLSHS
jgi:hypothetical protein